MIKLDGLLPVRRYAIFNDVIRDTGKNKGKKND